MQEIGFPWGIDQDYNRVSSPVKFLHRFQFHPIVHQLIVISNHLFQLTPMKRDKGVKTGLVAPSLTVQHCSTTAAGMLQGPKQKPSHLSPDSFHS